MAVTGLNRTMQYGNYDMAETEKERWLKFKSYYVVWKRFLMDKGIFKGYRLNRTMQYGNLKFQILKAISLKFKSYYVVWKQAEGPDINQGDICLNRTMQYGNMIDGQTTGKTYLV